MKQALFTVNGELVLASASPRRRGFLEELGLPFLCRPAEIVEVQEAGEGPAAFVSRLAREKATAIAELLPTAWVLGADTVVVLDEQILGKPADPAAATAMLRQLSGRWHQVWTGFAIYRADRALLVERAVTTEVCFAGLSPELIAAYVATGEPLDKAGSYGIQGQGGCLVEEVRGSYSNVVGLPLAEVIGELLTLGVLQVGGQP